MSTQAGHRIQVVLINPSGVRRDLGAGKAKGGGGVTSEITKSRPGGGDEQYVWPAPKETENITVTFEAWVIRPHYAFADATVGRGKAELTLVRLNSEFTPVENLWVKEAMLMTLGDIETDANSTAMADVELEFVVGKVAA
jgi:hypothetical protein